MLDKGSVLIGSIASDSIKQSIELARAMKNNGEEVRLAHDYVDTNVSVKVVKIIQSYVQLSIIWYGVKDNKEI